jgi:hypothetical protein
MLPNIFLKSAQACGMSHLATPAQEKKGHFYVEKNQVLSHLAPEGVVMQAQETAQGIKAQVIIQKGVRLKEPLFFCFGLSGQKEQQEIVPEITLEEGAHAEISAHCSFPNASKSSHVMEGLFKIKKNASFIYKEAHYHGEESGMTTVPKLKVEVGENALFQSDFNLSKGTVGEVNIEVEAHLAAKAKSEITTKVFGKNQKDQVNILDKVYLEGAGSRSLIKMRAAAQDGGQVVMQGETYASAAGATGHVDCQEIVIGQNSRARAVPIVEVTHEEARVTHEALVGKVNQKELEALMTRGLSEEEATELLISAMMRS